MTFDESVCPRFQRATEMVGARWNGAILMALLEGRGRYADIKGAIPGLSDTMLAQRLRTLEAEEVVERRVIPSSPVHVEYRLTERGRALAPVVDALMAWSHDWLPEPLPS